MRRRAPIQPPDLAEQSRKRKLTRPVRLIALLPLAIFKRGFQKCKKGQHTD